MSGERRNKLINAYYRDNQPLYFGDSKDASIQWDGSGLIIAGATTLSDVATFSGSPLFDSGSIFIKEQAAAEADVTAYGQVWVKDDAPNTLWYTDDAGTDVQLGASTGAAETYIVKTADESVTSSTTLQDDNHFTGIALTANKRYAFEMFLRITGNATMDMKSLFVFSQTPQAASWGDAGTRAHSYIQVLSTEAGNDDITDTEVFNLAAGVIVMRIDGFFQANATTGGTLKFQWAQNTSNGTALVVYEGSWMRLSQLD